MQVTHVEKRQRRKQIALDYAKGASAPDLARRYGVCLGTVHVALRERGLRTNLNAAARARRESMAAQVRTGVPPPEVARACGVSVHTVQSAMREFGVTWRRQRVRSRRDYDRMHRMLRIVARLLGGESETSISQHFAVTRQRVNQIALAAKKAGVLKGRDAMINRTPSSPSGFDSLSGPVEVTHGA